MAVLEGLVRAACKLPGAFVECGVYKGGSLLRISEVSGGRTVYGFDLFGPGLPEPGEHDTYKGGEFDGNTIEEVRASLPSNAELYRGPFSQSLSILEVTRGKIVFAHIDADLYQSTADCCRYLYHCMSPGGIMLFDDYGGEFEPGVKKAVDEFFERRPEVVLPLTTLQAVVIKCG